MRTLAFLIVCTFALPCFGAEEYRVMKLEQDVRNLERQVLDLQRQIAELQQQGRSLPAPRRQAAPAPPATTTLWLDPAKWDQVRVGMKELEVIELLGPPTSLRGTAESGTRTLMYAVEIGTSAFLGGSVRLQDREVVEVSPPVLK